MFRLHDVHYYYDDGTHALKGISIEINKKRTVIVGNNGAGKTTLLMHLNGLLKPKKGYVEYRGKKIRYDKKSLIELRKEVSLVFQNPDDQIVAPTVEQDVAFGLVNIGIEDFEERVKEALEIVGLKGYEKRLCSSLSFGEKKKVAIAGVLVMKPRVMLLDEPTSGLDPKSKKEFTEILEGIDSMLIITTHDMDFAHEFANEIIVMNNGRIVEKGLPEVVFLRDLEKYGLRSPVVVEIYKSLGLNEKLPRKIEDLIKIIKQQRA